MTNESPDMIKSDIERTRAQLADTVDALTEKLEDNSRKAQRAALVLGGLLLLVLIVRRVRSGR